MKSIILTIFFSAFISLNAQISFEREFGIYKLQSEDKLRSLNTFDPDGNGKQIFAGYANPLNHSVRIVRYSFKGEVVENKSFALHPQENYLASNLFRLNDANHLLILTLFKIDSLSTDSVTKEKRKRSYKYLKLYGFNYDNKESLDTMSIFIGIYDSISTDSYRTVSLSTNFITPLQSGDSNTIFIGVTSMEYEMQAPYFFKRNQFTSLFKVGFENGSFSSAKKLSNCGSDFYYDNKNIISTGFTRNYISGSAGGWDYKNQFILKSEDGFISKPDTLYKVEGHFRSDQYFPSLYENYISCFSGMFNNFPVESGLMPLFGYFINHDYPPIVNGRFFFSFSKDLNQIKYSVQEQYNEKIIEKAHTYIRLKDSSYACLYFTSGPLFIRSVSDGRLLYQTNPA